MIGVVNFSYRRSAALQRAIELTHEARSATSTRARLLPPELAGLADLGAMDRRDLALAPADGGRLGRRARRHRLPPRSTWRRA